MDLGIVSQRVLTLTNGILNELIIVIILYKCLEIVSGGLCKSILVNKVEVWLWPIYVLHKNEMLSSKAHCLALFDNVVPSSDLVPTNRLFEQLIFSKGSLSLLEDVFVLAHELIDAVVSSLVELSFDLLHFVVDLVKFCDDFRSKSDCSGLS